uniref:Lon protease homolog n=1 Tax=Albugo laibachii Nc14 TaxID=890382 RepID=F0WHF6_9STRA|nr:unnamed protein product putative [Albugo laibachii Nc14]|eukprot:CCA20675.1 unnamed protein product putative [Albugo laibachii Nc14]
MRLSFGQCRVASRSKCRVLKSSIALSHNALPRADYTRAFSIRSHIFQRVSRAPRPFLYNRSIAWFCSANNDSSDPNKKAPEESVSNEDVSVIEGNAVTPLLEEGDKNAIVSHVVIVPTHRRPFFPGVIFPMTISDPQLRKSLISLKKSGQHHVGVFLRKNASSPSAEVDASKDLKDNEASLQTGIPASSQHQDDEVIHDLSEIHHVGSLARLDSLVPLDANNLQVLLVSQRRIVIESLLDSDVPLRVNIGRLEAQEYDAESKLVRAYSNEIVATLREIVKLNPLFKDHMQFFSRRIDIHNPFKLADFAASVTTADGEDLQLVMEEMNCELRLKKSLELITKELELSKVQQVIKEQVEAKISKNQRQYLLMEQLKVIKKELGMEKDDKEAMIQKFRERIDAFEPGWLPEAAQAAIDEEIQKLEMLEKNSSEFNVTRNYLEWLTLLPWGRATEENFDIQKAKKVLDNDHYGLSDIKERILEFIAVSKLKESVQGKIICFVGPPGVGKTSIGKSIAECLNREFYRFSVGGLSDVAEIKGHRRTYVGAMPGKVIQCLKTTQSSNPLILIDEIDKLGKGYQGDPASALLELLDPSQNQHFVDHFMDVPVDLSRILFICTANVTDTIPGPLLDRMEVLRLSGYDAPEKLSIAREYLVPKVMKRTGLDQYKLGCSEDITFCLTDDAILTLVKQYCRESGLRNLEQHIERIFRKVALEIVQEQEKTQNGKLDLTEESDKYRITAEKLFKYVGKPIYQSDRMYDIMPPGVVMGLAWTAMGGSSLYIETTSINLDSEKAGLITTGQMGSVMEESTKIAHTYARHKLQELDPTNSFFKRAEIHMHVPEGATPKDGPSAGCTMVTALLSLALDKAVRPDLAMTGEVSLTGKVLPVGGIKEKTIAAKGAGVSVLVLPKGNQRDYEELEEYLRKDLDVHFAESYADVYKVAFTVK